MDTVSEMAHALIDAGVDLSDDEAVKLALIDAGIPSSHINVFQEEAVEEARTLTEIGGNIDSFFQRAA